MTTILSLLGIVHEIMQMSNMRIRYFKGAENYADLVIFPGALIVTLVPFITGYTSWIHGLGCVLIIVTAYRMVLMLTHIPVLGLGFIMLTMGVKRVALYSPIVLFFGIAFAVVFQNLLQNKDSFSNLGFAFMKVMTMSIGELEFNDTFFDSSHHEPFVILAFLLLLVFIAIITISMMNLLIGISVGDIRKLRHRAEQLAFESQLILICNALYIFKMGDRMHNRRLHEIRKIHLIPGISIKYDQEDLKKKNTAFFNDLDKAYREFIATDDDIEKLLKKMLYNQLDHRSLVKEVKWNQEDMMDDMKKENTDTKQAIQDNNTKIKEIIDESLRENSILDVSKEQDTQQQEQNIRQIIEKCFQEHLTKHVSAVEEQPGGNLLEQSQSISALTKKVSLLENAISDLTVQISGLNKLIVQRVGK